MYHVPYEHQQYECVFTFYGRKNEVDFLNRIYKLIEIPAKDSRAKNFQEEICSYCLENGDYPEWWVFDDDRLSLGQGTDEELLRFISEMFHPAIRKKDSDWENVLNKLNILLESDGYEIYESGKISNHSLYSYRSII